MRWHSPAALLRPEVWRERSTRLGAAAVVVAGALGASFTFDAGELAEYAGRWAVLGPAVLAALGFLGIVRRDREP